jgi:hypothetical protein
MNTLTKPSSENVRVDDGTPEDRDVLLGAERFSQRIKGTVRAIQVQERQAEQEGTMPLGTMVQGKPWEKLRRLTFPNRSHMTPPAPACITLQEWEGYVTDIGSETFEAILVDVSSGNRLPQSIAEIPLDELSEEEVRRLCIGSIFRWVISFEKRGSTQRRVSEVVVRHLPAWSRKDTEEARQAAIALGRDLRALAVDDAPEAGRD